MTVYLMLQIASKNQLTPSQLKKFAKQLAGPKAIDCGRSVSGESNYFKVEACAVNAFRNKQPFYVYTELERQGGISFLLPLVLNCDYVILNSKGEILLLRWNRRLSEIGNHPVRWELKPLYNMQVRKWGWPSDDFYLDYEGR